MFENALTVQRGGQGPTYGLVTEFKVQQLLVLRPKGQIPGLKITKLCKSCIELIFYSDCRFIIISTTMFFIGIWYQYQLSLVETMLISSTTDL